MSRNKEISYSKIFKPPEDLVWIKGMALPPGRRLPDDFIIRIARSKLKSGAGTVGDPMVVWIYNSIDQGVQPASQAGYSAINGIVKKELIDLGLTHAWIAKEGHGLSTLRKTRTGDRISSDDDWHITLRMGTAADWCNLHGHFYLVYEDNNKPKESIALRMMEDEERGLVGGKNPQLWTYGKLPRGYVATNVKYPKAPYEIVPGSILDRREIQPHIQLRR